MVVLKTDTAPFAPGARAEVLEADGVAGQGACDRTITPNPPKNGIWGYMTLHA